ncbi:MULTISPECIES: hypothetical protein [unclassified Anabaena]|uniref:hypothetical protein n=1 Tax=unclassified Anabaena TaxID=2619674 RepID=UPI0039C732D8
MSTRQSTPTFQVLFGVNVERTTKQASRIIVRQEGVVLSMLRNVKSGGIKNKYQRKNRG